MHNANDVRAAYRALRQCALAAEDMLLVYFAGHGRASQFGELYLSLRQTDPDELKVSALAYDLVRDVFAECSAGNRIIILDCCFSGMAIRNMGSDIAGSLAVAGTYILTATPPTALALAPPGERYTAFTGELLSVLNNGIVGGAEYLTFDALYPRLLRTMIERRMPQPQRQGSGLVERLALCRNVAFAGAQPLTGTDDEHNAKLQWEDRHDDQTRLSDGDRIRTATPGMSTASQTAGELPAASSWSWAGLWRSGRARMAIIASAMIAVIAVLLYSLSATSDVGNSGSATPKSLAPSANSRSSESPISHQGSGQEAEPNIPPAHYVLLVDESGSVREEEMFRQREAVDLVIYSELSPRSTVAVMGFGSDGVTSQAVDIVCPQTSLTTALERDHLHTCAGLLHKRTRAEGDGTDHAQALQQAVASLMANTPHDEARIVFLLTDGELYVADSTRYGIDKTSQERTDAAREALKQTLAMAKVNGIEIWPIGFGRADRSSLDSFATEGFQRSCGDRTKPLVQIATNSSDIAAAAVSAFSAARCIQIGPPSAGQLSSDGHLTLSAVIPAGAIDELIIVVKGDRRIKVQFSDPRKAVVPKSGQTDSGKFTSGDENAEIEALRIINPTPGTWTIGLTSSPDVPPQNVLTSVVHYH